MNLSEHKRYDEGHKEIDFQNSGEISRLSTKMVELSLQDAQRDPPSREAIRENLSPLSSPSFQPLPGLTEILEPSIQKTAGPPKRASETAAAPAANLIPQERHGAPQELRIKKFAFLYSQTKVVLGNIRVRWDGFASARERIVGLRFAARRTTLLIRDWSRTLRARTLRLVHRARFALDNRYRCPDCGREIGTRSRPRNMSERYILPLFLMQPVRCTACFHRDYRLIFTQVHHCSRRYASTLGNSNHNTA